MGKGGGRAASPTSWGAAGHSTGMGEVCAGTDVNGPSWAALASPGFSQAVRRHVSISLGARGWQGSFSPAACQLSLPILLARHCVRHGVCVCVCVQTLSP